MTAWSDGYFTQIPYTRNFFFQMAPGYLTFACARQGVRPPTLGPGSVYLELGCGHGFGLALLAAANPEMSFVGVDFLPGQIANGQRLARVTGLENLTLEELSFEQVLALPEGRLPKCDVIALHGVYTWISPENRAAIVRILDRLLKPGGLVYISYNTLPGWGEVAPLQRFVRDYVAQGAGSPEVEVMKAFEAARAMADSDVQYFNKPTVKAHIESALKGAPAYVVHEYLNEQFHPLYHADVARELSAAKLSYAASATPAEDMLHLAAPVAAQPQIKAARDETWRQTLLDYAVNRRFRRDVFVRGRNAIGALERERLLGQTRFMLMTLPENVDLEFPIPIGKLGADPAFYRPIIDALAAEPRSYRELATLSGAADQQILQALSLLVGHGIIHPAPDSGTPGRSQAAVRFNRALASDMPLESGPFYLAAGHAGTALHVNFTEMVAVAAPSEKPADVKAAAARAADAMARLGGSLQKDGQAVTDRAAIEAELTSGIEAFNREKRPLFRRLGAA